MQLANAPIMRREKVAPEHCVLELECPEIASSAAPGQFIHLRVAGTDDPLLRRPLSIMLCDVHRGRIEVLVRAAGKGTRMLCGSGLGGALDVIGPLGNGFPLPQPGQRPLLVAGGVGVAPLIFLANALQLSREGYYVRGLFGAATQDALVCWQDFAGRCEEFSAATEDGSAGGHGLVTDAMPEQLRRGDVDVVYTCGPRPMMAKVAQLCEQAHIPCWASLEQFMGCGVGACLGCVIPTNLTPGNQRVCTDGPVFNARDVIWQELTE